MTSNYGIIIPYSELSQSLLVLIAGLSRFNRLNIDINRY